MIRRSRSDALVAFVAYQAIAFAMTWPLLPGLLRDVPGDLGDPLLNLWILAWGAEQAPRLLTGQIALHDYWNANIFHPEPLALSFSEHLFGQVLQILPIYHLTGNILLSYNLLFLTTFSLSGLGMFLLVRDLLQDPLASRHATGDSAASPAHARSGDGGRRIVYAAAVAGLIYAFVPYRIAQVAHLQSLSSQWMPLALYGLRRFVVSGRWPPLAGGSAALLMQNLSCGYYLIYFAPFVPVFVLHQLWAAGRLLDWRRWVGLAAGAGAVALGTWPFLVLYLEAQHVYGFQRPLGEVMTFSADVYSYFTAPDELRVWGSVMRALPRPEGRLFFGMLPLVLAGVALVAAARSTFAAATGQSPASGAPSRTRAILTRLLVVIALLQAAALATIVFTGGVVTSVAGIPLRASNATRLLTNFAAVVVLILAVSPRARRDGLVMLRWPVTLPACLALGAVWMSLGPVPHTRGGLLQVPPIYAFFYDHVPGFEGLRVPARYAMIAAVFLCIVAGHGTLSILRRTGRAPLVAAALAAVYLTEAAFAPMPVNVSWGGTFVTPPARVEPARDAPAVYQHLATMPDVVALAEFPFGDISWELRYVYYSTVHWKRLLNGYSGGFPQGYKARVALLERVGVHPEEAWRALREAGTSHVIVHEAAYTPEEFARVTRWLDDHFAVEIARFDGDRLYDVDGVFDRGTR